MNRVASLVMVVTLCLVGFLGFRLFETASTLYENNQSFTSEKVVPAPD